MTKHGSLMIALVLLVSTSPDRMPVLAEDGPSQLAHRTGAIADRPIEADRAYAALLTLPDAPRKQLLRALPTHLQRDLWSYQLRQLLERNIDLTRDQRSVVYELLGLLSAGILEHHGPASMNRLSSVSSSATDELVADMLVGEQRLRTNFAHTKFADSFRRLGGVIPTIAGPADQIGLAELRAMAVRPVSNFAERQAMLPECDCSQESDWCDSITNPDFECEPRSCSRSESGCGTFLLYACNGMCW